MSSAILNPDDAESQFLFLNFCNSPNTPDLCNLTSAVIDSLLVMIGLTRGFVASLTLPEKKSIVLLASYAVDWRECGRDYDDMVFCFGRGHKWEKSVASGLAELHCDNIDYAKHIQVTRIQPNILQLRESSYRLNRGTAAVVPPGVAVPQAAGPPITTTFITISTNTPPSSGQTSPAPAMDDSSNLTVGTTTASTAATTITVATTPNASPLSGQTLIATDDSDVDSSPPGSTPRASSSDAFSQDSASDNAPSEAGASSDIDMPPSGQPQDGQPSATADSGAGHTGSNTMDAQYSNNDVQAADNNAAKVADDVGMAMSVSTAGSDNGGSDKETRQETQQDADMQDGTDQVAETNHNMAQEEDDIETDHEEQQRPNKKQRTQ
ncbi:hypothetical protein E0Z10_g4191 [Xylaria hypoxylon]|uniref:Uncharacterized protein n=1 Tax=Xylaria hypoxylon TaxID=37992 RepID=A0A4Z0YZF4_9PEZI|nr:hypothetical protein E0Z10_g4191 [Xylaria hypoxylon]